VFILRRDGVLVGTLVGETSARLDAIAATAWDKKTH